MGDAGGKGMVNNNYRISRRIGGGSFGEIYLGIGPSGDQGELKKPIILSSSGKIFDFYVFLLFNTLLCHIHPCSRCQVRAIRREVPSVAPRVQSLSRTRRLSWLCISASFRQPR